MSYYEDMLKRTELKYLGEYLMSGGTPGPEALSRSQTEKQLLDRAYGRLEASLAGLGEPAAGPIRSAAGALGADHQRVGFCSGLRVGARLMRSLMDSTGIVY